MEKRQAYLFIDGQYLRYVWQKLVHPLYGPRLMPPPGQLGILGLIGLQNLEIRKKFFYDCADEMKRNGETEEASIARIAHQRDLHAAIRDLPGYHVRLGSLSGTAKRRRQKQVDVALAVDMLTHGFAKNYEVAVLLAGDLDFKPVAEAVVRLGRDLIVWGEPTSTARGLRDSAEAFCMLDIESLFGFIPMSSPVPPLPTSGYDKAGEIGKFLKAGESARESWQIYEYVLSPRYRAKRKPKVQLPLHMLMQMTQTKCHDDLPFLESYLQVLSGPVKWT